MSTAPSTTREPFSRGERLAVAELELELFERQPPLGWRAYQRGRNARKVVVVTLRAELTDPANKTVSVLEN